MSSNSGSEFTNDSSSSTEAEKPQIEPIRMPTVEEIRGQDIWNNCAVRSVASGVMGENEIIPLRFIMSFLELLVWFHVFFLFIICLVAKKRKKILETGRVKLYSTIRIGLQYWVYLGSR